MALQHHAQRVAHQDGLGAGLADNAGKGGVIGGDADELFPRCLHFAQGADRYLGHRYSYPKKVGLK